MAKYIKDPKYLGDAVYVHIDSSSDTLVLTTEHHDPIQAGHVIYLDQQTLNNLFNYIAKHKRRL